jgi:hypothetical protein
MDIQVDMGYRERRSKYFHHSLMQGDSTNCEVGFMPQSVKDMLGSWRGQKGSIVFDVVCMKGTKCMLF